MKNKILAVTLIYLFLSCSGLYATQDKKGAQVQNIELPAPDFQLDDLNGQPHKLSDYKGRIVLLDFTTTWCPYCKKDVPYLKEKYKAYKDRDLELIAIFIQESGKRVSAFKEKHDIPYKILLDKDGSVARAYGIRGVPTKILVGKDGKIYCYACRSLDVMLDKLIEKKD